MTHKDDLNFEFLVLLDGADQYENDPCARTRLRKAIIVSFEFWKEFIRMGAPFVILALCVWSLVILFFKPRFVYFDESKVSDFSIIIVAVAIPFLTTTISNYWSLSAIYGSKWKYLVDTYNSNERKKAEIIRKLDDKRRYFLGKFELDYDSAYLELERQRDEIYIEEIKACLDALWLGMWNEPVIRRHFFVNLEYVVDNLLGDEWPNDRPRLDFRLSVYSDRIFSKREVFLLFSGYNELVRREIKSDFVEVQLDLISDAKLLLKQKGINFVPDSH